MSHLSRRVPRRSIRRVIAVFSTFTMLACLVPSRLTAIALQSSHQVIGAAGKDILHRVSELNMTAEQRFKGVRPTAPLTKAEREGRVAMIEINPAGDVTVRSRQPLTFTAIPLDQEGMAIHGLRITWESTNKQVLFIRSNGQALAGKAGEAIVIARAGNKQASVRVVVDGTAEFFGGKKKVDSKRTQRQMVATRQDSTVHKPITRRERAHAGTVTRVGGVLPFIREPNDDPLPDNETSSLYQPNNLIGTPPGKRNQEP